MKTEPTTHEDLRLIAAITEEHGPLAVLELVAQVCEDLAATETDPDESAELDDIAVDIREFISEESGE